MEEFIYLGSIISTVGKSKNVRRKQICQAKVTFIKKEPFLFKRYKPLNQKNLLKTYVWSFIAAKRERTKKD